MVSVSILLGIVAVYGAFLAFKSGKVRIVPISICGIMVIPAIAFICCYYASVNNVPDEYEYVPVYFIHEGEVICSEQEFVKHEDYYYSVSSVGKALWIPGAAFAYENEAPLDDLCKNCEIFCSMDYCVRCGAQLADMNCDHAMCENLVYCGDCGARIGEGD